VNKNCIFCKIAIIKAASNKIYEDENVFSIRDINPQAPVHILIIPKKHISWPNVNPEDEYIFGHIQIIALKMAKQFYEMKNGFRIIGNCGVDGGQTIFHIHYHLLGGRLFTWPPG
jgi:histidine triad (HIT) family protein